MIPCLSENGTKLGVIFQMRFGSVGAKLTKLVASGALGKIHLADASTSPHGRLRTTPPRRGEGHGSSRGRMPDDAVPSISSTYSNGSRGR